MQIRVSFKIDVDEDDTDKDATSGITEEFYDQISDAAMSVGGMDVRVEQV